jgi:hypothetical protein
MGKPPSVFFQRTLRWTPDDLTPVDAIFADLREWLSFKSGQGLAHVIIPIHLDVQKA